MENNKISVLVVEPQKKPYLKEISSELHSLQREVDGYIEAVYPFHEPVAIICDEEGKLNGKPFNRALRDENGNIYDVLVGTFLIAGLGEEDFISLTPPLADQFAKLFATPEKLVNLGSQRIVLPCEECE